jgi:hypothetical protein
MVQILKKEKEALTKKKAITKNKKNIKVTDKQTFKIIEGMTEATDHYHNQYIEKTERLKKKQQNEILINTLKKSGILIAVYIGVLIAYILIGYNTACMITRYYHYFKMELDNKNKEEQTDIDNGFLGINQTLKEGKITDPDGIYCKAEGANSGANTGQNDTNNDTTVKDGESQGGAEQKVETVNSAGITKKNAVHTYPLYGGDEEGKCLTDSDEGFIGTSKKVSIMNFVFLRKMFHSVIKTFIILKDEDDKNKDVQQGDDDKKEEVPQPKQTKQSGLQPATKENIEKNPNKILYNNANSLSVIAPIILVIGVLLIPIFIFFYSIYNTLFNSKRNIYGYFGGAGSALLDPFVIMAYGLAFMIGFGTDSFAKNYLRTDIEELNKLGDLRPNFLGYLFSPKTLFMVLIWTIVLMIHMGLTNLENPIILTVYLLLASLTIMRVAIPKIVNFDIYNTLGRTFGNTNKK